MRECYSASHVILVKNLTYNSLIFYNNIIIHRPDASDRAIKEPLTHKSWQTLTSHMKQNELIIYLFIITIKYEASQS